MGEPPLSVGVTVRILIADDHPVYRQRLRELLGTEPDLCVVGEAGDGHVAVRAARALEPDVVVMDVEMPEIGGIQATREVVSALPGVRVIALSMHQSPELVDAMLQAGASGYVLKDGVQRDFLAALRAIASGDTWLSPELR